MSTLRFQPAADRYYAEGHWRPGDLWEDFAAAAHAGRGAGDRGGGGPALPHVEVRRGARRGKVALVLDGRRVPYDELPRAAVALSPRLATAAVQPGDVVLLLGRHSL